MARVTNYKVELLLRIDLMRIVCMWSSMTVASDVFLFRRVDIRIVQRLMAAKQRKMPCQNVVSCYISLFLFFFILYKQPLVENFEIGIYFSTSQWQFNYLFPVD